MGRQARRRGEGFEERAQQRSTKKSNKGSFEGLFPDTSGMEPQSKSQQACLQVMKVIMNNKNSGPVAVPVDYVNLGIPDYPRIIKHPMDLGTVLKKLNGGEYGTVDEWVSDVRLVFTNATTFNPADHVVHQMAKTLSGILEKKLP